MALNFKLQLENSTGLMKVVIFTGLSHPIVVRPTVHGEPLLTAQPFYYLQDLDSIGHVRFESHKQELTFEQIEYLVDNYLFEYSKLNSESKMTFKVTKAKFWKEDVHMYMLADQMHTESLVLDQLNDPAVASVEAIDDRDTVDLNDWNIGRNYVDEPFHAYISSLRAVLDKKVLAIVEPRDGRDGYLGKLRVVKAGDGLIDHFQAEGLERICIRSIPNTSSTISLGSDTPPYCEECLPIERIYTDKQYTPILLSHYFSGLKEFNPLKAFVGFYNVLEYLFEEAPIILGVKARNELEQLKCVVSILAADADIRGKVSRLGATFANVISNDMQTSSGVPIKGMSVSPTTDMRDEISRWLYEIRCAVVHSKKTRKGQVTPTFEPYSVSAKNVQVSLPLIKWLAILCIEKDYALNASP